MDADTTVPPVDELIDVATTAARAAGALLLERFTAGTERALRSKSTPTDLVSEADLAGERMIREILHARRPGDAVLGEEGGAVARSGPSGGAGLRWIVDPLDGTVNFLFGYPQWCVSVACEGIAGVVFDPVRDELFAGAHGHRATLNDIPLAGSSRRDLGTALVATGFGYDAGIRERQATVVARLLPRVRDIRRGGSAALDLAWTAAGRLDAYYEHGVQVWDTAAGAIVCAGAGLLVEALPARDGLPGGILAAPAALAPALRELVS
jgi:myo-inositol-1(or 4)-monophosphatase